MQRWKTLRSTIVHQNPHYQIREDEIEKPNGETGKYYVFDQSDSVMIVPLTDKNEVYLIGIFRYTTQMFSWELPGGKMENKNIVENAKKELQEETGLVSEEWEDMGACQAMNGSANKLFHVFLARHVTQTGTNAQAEEGITELKKIPFSKVMYMVKHNEITDSHTIAALTVTGLKLGLIVYSK